MLAAPLALTLQLLYCVRHPLPGVINIQDHAAEFAVHGIIHGQQTNNQSK